MKYHVGTNGPGRCSAQIACPFQPGGAKDDGVMGSISGMPADYHFATQEDAYKAYEKKLNVQYASTPQGLRKEVQRARKANKSLKNEHYRNLDYAKVLEANGKPLRASVARLAIIGKLAGSSNRGQGTGRRAGSPLSSARRISRTLRGHRRRGRKLKKLLLTKYWMPDIRSNKWK